MGNTISRRLGAIFFAVAGALALPSGSASASSAPISKPVLITQAIADNQLIELKGNIRPEATPANDRGPVADNFKMNLQLQLRRSAQQEAELKRFIDELHNPKSPNYHQWLTAKTFGERFGLNAQDLTAITTWLRAQGFQVNSVYPNKTLIDFSGTAAQVRNAFHTQIHQIEIAGESHFANVSNPQIPAALAPAVVGVLSLHDIQPRMMNRPRSDYTYTNSNGSTYEAVVPSDLATIYNLNPLFDEGLSGQGQTIVLISVSDVYDSADWDTFRSTFGLSSYTEGSFKTIHPAPASGRNNCIDPGVTSAQAEAAIDTQWSTAAAPSASIVLAACKGLSVALQNVINGKDVSPSVISVSYGECEAYNGEAANAAYSSAYQQAVTQGISVFVSSGDQGAASCDAGASSATHGISVSGLTATPYNVSVGGTDFFDYKETKTYWSDTNSPTFGSALSYVPEIPWNDSCASDLLAAVNGFGVTYGSQSFCNSYDGSGDAYLTTAAGSGGPSGCATGVPDVSGVVSGTCAGEPKPSWQTGVLGIPNDGVRDIPDISLFAANGVWGHYYIICDTYRHGSCDSSNPSAWAGYGGTSISSPIMAGIQALANQAAGSLQGNPNYVYYSLAASEYGANGSSSCNSTLGFAVDSACLFYDVTQGDIDVNCTGPYNCYLPSGTAGVLSTDSASFLPAYGTATGWDFSTGIGSVNAFNLVRTFGPAVSLSSTSLSFGTVKTGTTSEAQTITLTNTGGAPLTISAITAAADFPETTTCGASLAAGASCTISISFAPTAATSYTESLTIASNAFNSPATIQLSGTGIGTPIATLSATSLSFGDELIGTTSAAQIVTLSNTGDATLTISAITPAADFPETTDCTDTLAPGASCSISISFAPTTAASYAESLTIASDAADSPATVSLTGTGVTGPAISLSPTSLAFGNQLVGTISAAQSVTLTNSGGSVLTIRSIGPATDFPVTTTCTETLAAGASCTISVVFAPAAAISYAESVTITSDASETPTTIAVTGTGVSASAVTVSPTALSFGSITVGGTSAAQAVTLSNTGGSDLTIVSIVSGADFPETTTCGTTLAPGASCTISVSFKPSSVTSFSETLTITTSALSSPTTVSLTGTGTAVTTTSSDSGSSGGGGAFSLDLLIAGLLGTALRRRKQKQ